MKFSRTIHTKTISAFSGNFTNPRANLRKGNLVATEVGDPDTFLFNSNRNISILTLIVICVND